MATMKVPLIGTNVVAEGASGGETAPTLMDREPSQAGGWQDGAFETTRDRTSNLHRMRGGRGLGAMMVPEAAAQTEPVWEENRHTPGHFDVRYRPAERSAEPETSSPPPTSEVSRQIGELTGAVRLLAEHQLGIRQQDAGPRMPDPSQYNFFDPQEEGQYHADLQRYVEETVQARLQAEFEPHREMLQRSQENYAMQKQFDALQAEHKNSPHFKRTMSAALELIADNPKLSVKEAFAQADDPRNARPGQRGNAHLPREINNVRSLGKIMFHNRQTTRGRR